MGTPMFDPADLDEVVDLLRALSVAGRDLSVDLDPSKVTAPGVWVQLREVEQVTLVGSTLRLNLYVIAPDSEVRVGLGTLADLLDVVAPMVNLWGGTTGPVRHVALGLPEGTLPALQLPVDVDTRPNP